MMIIEGRLEQELTRLALLRAPLEACGVISSDGLQVIEVPNRATPGVEGQFTVERADLFSALKNLDNDDMSDVTFFHTHPGGGIGPSRYDMQQKTSFPNHLVVTLIDGDIVTTWY